MTMKKMIFTVTVALQEGKENHESKAEPTIYEGSNTCDEEEDKDNVKGGTPCQWIYYA